MLISMYTIQHGPIKIICESAHEFEHAMDYIRSTPGDASKMQGQSGLAGLVGLFNPAAQNPWTPRVFSDFVAAIGGSQRTVLALLVRQIRATDSQLREAVGVDTNQRLAGVLSGLSKQAATFNLPARAVFTIENESKSGETKKTYVVSNHFLETATENNWPLDETSNPEQGNRR